MRDETALRKCPEQFIQVIRLIFILTSQIDLMSRLIRLFGYPACQRQVPLGSTCGLDIKIYAAGHIEPAQVSGLRG